MRYKLRYIGPLVLASLTIGTPGCNKSENASPAKPAGKESPVAQESSALDGDGNGLYDDYERKALLDVFLKECPDLLEILNTDALSVNQAASNYQEDFEEGSSTRPAANHGVAARQLLTFDANGDGKVTIQEQSGGWHPLSVLMPTSITQSGRKIPWTIDIFPEWISSAYLQEDVALGAVADQMPRGTIPAKAGQPDTALQPSKSASQSGVEFAANSGEFLIMPGTKEARWDYRWSLLTFRVDAGSSEGKETVLLDLNKGEGSNHSSPKIWFNKDTGLNVQFIGLNKGGIDRRIMTGRNITADGKSWNVLICGIRYGQMFASLNGIPLSTSSPQPERFSGEWPKESQSFLGDTRKDNMGWAFDALVFGLTEPSEEMVKKMTGWAAHRLRFADSLPEGHPYKHQRPILDMEDFPTRYRHDDPKWNSWGTSVKDKTITRVNAGGKRVEPEGFERVFYDDFRADRMKASSSGEGDLWLGPGFNVAVGGDAPLIQPGRQPDAYPHDADKQFQTLSLIHDGKRWRGSAIYTVNDLGHGYTWKGPKVIRIRCMFPKVAPKDLVKGLFPAFWSYAPDNLVWRTSNRIEVDWFEFDGQSGTYLNGLSTHYHYPYLKKNNIFAKNINSYKRYKVYGGELAEEKSKIPGGIFIWDGQFHTWEWVVDKDMTYANVTIPDGEKGERWVEIYRCPTAPIYLEALDLQLDYALKAKHGVPKPEERQDLVVDWIEVLQKTDQLEKVPKPFVKLPSLSGSNTLGSSVICDAGLNSVADIRYFWFADGYPITWGPNNTLLITTAEEGKSIRCMVKAVGGRDMPDAWSEELR